MAIKNKVKPIQFTEDPTQSITPDKMKAESHSAVKMLIKKGYDVKTPFFVKAQHFKGDKVKFKGVFLAIGESPALLKKFKEEKTSPYVSYGNLFVKQIKGEDIVHFEYVSGQGKLKKPGDWKALFKEFKKMFKKKCAFVLDGQTQDTEDENTDEKPTNDQPEVATTKPAKVDKAASPVAQLNTQYQSLRALYVTVKDEEHSPRTTKQLYKKLKAWKADYDQLEDKAKSLLEKAANEYEQVLKKVGDILKVDKGIDNMIEELVNTVKSYATSEDHSTPEAKKLKNSAKPMLKRLKKYGEMLGASELLKQAEIIEQLLAD